MMRGMKRVSNTEYANIGETYCISKEFSRWLDVCVYRRMDIEKLKPNSLGNIQHLQKLMNRLIDLKSGRVVIMINRVKRKKILATGLIESTRNRLVISRHATACLFIVQRPFYRSQLTLAIMRSQAKMHPRKENQCCKYDGEKFFHLVLKQNSA